MRGLRPLMASPICVAGFAALLWGCIGGACLHPPLPFPLGGFCLCQTTLQREGDDW